MYVNKNTTITYTHSETNTKTQDIGREAYRVDQQGACWEGWWGLGELWSFLSQIQLSVAFSLPLHSSKLTQSLFLYLQVAWGFALIQSDNEIEVHFIKWRDTDVSYQS